MKKDRPPEPVMPPIIPERPVPPPGRIVKDPGGGTAGLLFIPFLVAIVIFLVLSG